MVDDHKKILAKRLKDTYFEYQNLNLEKRENTKKLFEVISQAMQDHALTVHDLRKLQVPGYIADEYVQCKFTDLSVSADDVIYYRHAINDLVEERIRIDTLVHELSEEILAIKQEGKNAGYSFLKILQATGELGENIKQATLYTLARKVADRSPNTQLEKMALYLLNKHLGMDINQLVSLTGKSAPTLYKYVREGRKIFEVSDRSMQDLSVEEIIKIARNDTPAKC